MLNMALLLRVVNEGEHVLVNQVVEEVNPPVEVGFDNCGTTLEPKFSINEGKPRMHLTYLVIYKLISLLLLFTALSENLIGALPTLFFSISTLLPVLIRICLVMLSYCNRTDQLYEIK